MVKRPTMPEPVKRAAIFRNMHKNGGHLICEETKAVLTEEDLLNRRVHIDHDPPLELRARDDNGNHYPAANDLDYLEVVSAIGHLYRTSKRRGLFRGDQTEIARSRKVRLSVAEHKARMAAKMSGEDLPKRNKRQWPSRPIQSRGFEKPVPSPDSGEK
jgi:hypothetical protein